MLVTLAVAIIAIVWSSVPLANGGDLSIDDTVAPSRAPTTSRPSISPTFRPTICFHSSTTVQTVSGVHTRIDQLRYQDQVLVYQPEVGTYSYSPIVAFTGVFPNKTGSGVQLSFGHQSVTLSDTHLVYARFSSSSDFAYYQAGELTTFSFLMVAGKPVKIDATRQVTKTGWYTPLTREGTIVVNGAVASCHTGPSHSVARLFYQPLHIYLDLFPRKKGLVPSATVHEHFYSIGFKRDSSVGKFIYNLLLLPLMYVSK